jgi:hypothetical protein
VVGLVDIIDGEEELSYIDDDILIETNKVEPKAVAPEKRKTANLTKGLEAKSPIDLDSGHENVHDEDLSRSPPPSFDEIERNVQALTGTSDAPKFRGKDYVPLEATSILILETLSLHHHFFTISCDG